LLEPHARAETYVESIRELCRFFEVKEYCLVGAMYDAVPHTRPIMVTGSSSDQEREKELRRWQVKRSGYQGPTTITVLLSENAPGVTMESSILLAHLPNYAQIEEDFMGAYTILRLLNQIFGFSLELEQIKTLGEREYKKLDVAVENNPQAKEMVRELEVSYDAEMKQKESQEALPKLSPEVEKFLSDVDKRFGSN
jgi:hypothetical protein